MKRFYCLTTALFSSVCFANDNFEVLFVSDGFTLNNKPAASVIYCAKTNEDDCLSFNLNSESFASLIKNGKIKSHKQSNINFNVTGTMSGRNITLSSNHETGAALKLNQNNEEKKVLKLDYVAQLYALPNNEPVDGSYIKFDRSTFTITDENYDILFSILN
ncbi:conserved exported hypothetical protein [Vibrio crassostreae]|nr:conserved exported hypothetical protein [Vibrio crassostreae]CAK2780930.1 conserved exported hypothetical protein [Vibrio crassostreae]CAK3385643.1 conserved exported hypothetical protein [Vibrio crassostreae]